MVGLKKKKNMFIWGIHDTDDNNFKIAKISHILCRFKKCTIYMGYFWGKIMYVEKAQLSLVMVDC